MRGGAAVTGNNGRTYAVVGTCSGPESNGRVAGIDQTKAQTINNSYIKHIRGIGGAARSQRYAVAHDFAGSRCNRVRTLGDFCNMRLNNIECHGPAGQLRTCRPARAVGIRIEGRVIDSNALLNVNYVYNTRAHFDHRLLTCRDLGDA